MKKYILMILSTAMMASCVDTVILPDDKTVDEDFWKTKENVTQIVGQAYKGLTSESLMERILIWGDFRSDELVYSTAPTNTTVVEDLKEIQAASIETDNEFNSWGDFYSVINYCNIVLKKAEGVMALDPNYTEGTYLSDRSQMLALRALCYFYLVRSFRDVPYITEAYMESSQDMNVTKCNPDSILRGCIADLQEAEKNALNPKAYDSDWRLSGFINRDGIDALLADICLWMGAVNEVNNKAKADEYYQMAIDYCDKVIASRNELYKTDASEVQDQTNIYHLESEVGQGMKKGFYDQIFGAATSSTHSLENIFEVNFNASNTGLYYMYARFGGTKTEPYLVIPSCYATVSSSDYSAKVWGTSNDMRMWNFVYGANNTSNEQFYVRKFITDAGGRTTASAETRPATQQRTTLLQNWIVYRLTDVLLMKAEAMNQLAGNDNTNVMCREAFNLVQTVDSRAILDASLSSDSLKWAKCNGNIETLILAERCRELCFEGKRYYDLLRYHYRHVGTDYTKTFNEMQAEAGFKGFQTISKDMKNLLKRKYSSGAEAAMAKLTTEPYLYMPVIQSEMDANPNLQQNPVYSESSKWSKTGDE